MNWTYWSTVSRSGPGPLVWKDPTFEPGTWLRQRSLLPVMLKSSQITVCWKTRVFFSMHLLQNNVLLNTPECRCLSIHLTNPWNWPELTFKKPKWYLCEVNSLKSPFKSSLLNWTNPSLSSGHYQPAPAVFVFPAKATANTETKWTSSTDSCPCFCSPGLILPHYFQPNQLCYISRQELHIKIMFDIIKKKKKKIRHMREVFNSCLATESCDRNARLTFLVRSGQRKEMGQRLPVNDGHCLKWKFTHYWPQELKIFQNEVKRADIC